MVKRVLASIYLLLSTIVLIAAIHAIRNHQLEVASLVVTYSMFVLAFPIMFLGYPICIGSIWILKELFGIDTFSNNYLQILIIWLALTGIGYFQWFYLLPLAVRSYRNKAQ
jgi:hypothetical protein